MNTYVKLVFVFALAGTLFSGYLTFNSLFSGVCPLNEPCPHFLGYPACVYGLVMFSAILIVSLLVLLKTLKINPVNLIKIITAISLLGILFSGYFTMQEVFFSQCPLGKCGYSLVLPTCLYGLLMYVIVFVLSFMARKKV